jgi:hypothetical protein
MQEIGHGNSHCLQSILLNQQQSKGMSFLKPMQEIRSWNSHYPQALFS